MIFFKNAEQNGEVILLFPPKLTCPFIYILS